MNFLFLPAIANIYSTGYCLDIRMVSSTVLNRFSSPGMSLPWIALFSSLVTRDMRQIPMSISKPSA